MRRSNRPSPNDGRSAPRASGRDAKPITHNSKPIRESSALVSVTNLAHSPLPGHYTGLAPQVGGLKRR